MCIRDRPGFQCGIDADDLPDVGYDLLVQRVTVSGVRYEGIGLRSDETTVVESCSVTLAGGRGISAAVVRGCTVLTSGGYGVYASTVADCRVESMSMGIFAIATLNCEARSNGEQSSHHGIYAENVQNCNGYALYGNGIRAQTVSNSTGISQYSDGLSVWRSAQNSVGEAYGATSAGISASNAVVQGCYGWASDGIGIHAFQVSDSVGYSQGTASTSHGIYCLSTVTNSRGRSAGAGGGYGIYGYQIRGCTGISAGSSGIYSAGRIVADSLGETIAPSSSAHGISGAALVTGSQGRAAAYGAGHGISATQVSASYGYAYTGAGNGINATFLATHSCGSRQSSEASRYGISAARAVGCYASQGENIAQKYDMP